MSMRFRVAIILTALAATALAAPALADNQAVVAKVDNVFAPRNVAVKPGETVTVTNEGGDHNVVWNDGGAPKQPVNPVPPDQWPAGGVTRTFTATGKYRFYCEAHADATDNFGMVGYVYVNAAGVLPPTLTGLTASATRTGVRVGFRASRAGTAKATFLRKVGRRFVRRWASTIRARQGANSKRIAQTLTPGSYRVEVVLTDANGLKSDKRTKTFAVR